MGKILIVVGLAIAALGLLVTLGLPLGRLPGDIVVRRDGFTLYLPIVTSILVSVLITLLLGLLRR